MTADKCGGPRLFGPVPSRRLGRSLGVDLVPCKTCSYDCIYCQLGCTTRKTVRRREYVGVEQVAQQLQERLRQGLTADYITLSGSGEPTLCSRLGSLIDRIKSITAIPVAILTNGSLLRDSGVRREVKKADLVIPSLDAGSELMFHLVNRPHPDVTHEGVIEGLRRFRQQYAGSMWLEVFLVGGITATQTGVEDIASLVRDISPDKVQLNTVTRPPCDQSACAVPETKMRRFAHVFECEAEVIVDYQGDTHEGGGATVSRNDILELLRRRPCTLGDVAAGLSMHRNEAVKHLEHLMSDGVIGAVVERDKRYYRAT
jgi:wyosine [tRNA(Phe)-imidazoG37] synthetase (radical SAM superfamily)